ncbi:MAG TPA: hypothetical protein VLJ39_13560 [Tepidisphaeraceae bacterium]|nr:hypothetical protein [Tepidisphaeraceae bacterium]
MKRHWIIVLAMVVAFVGASMAVRAADEKKEEGKEVKIKFSEAPEAVQKTLKEVSKGAKIETIDKEEDAGKTIYEADAVIDGTNYEIKVAEDGKLISKNVDKEENEKKGARKEKD